MKGRGKTREDLSRKLLCTNNKTLKPFAVLRYVHKKAAMNVKRTSVSRFQKRAHDITDIGYRVSNNTNRKYLM